MLYIIDTNDDEYFHGIIHFNVLNELQLFHFATFYIHNITMHNDDEDDTDERNLMLSVHEY